MTASLQYRLSASISLAVVAVAGSAAAFTFVASLNDANIAQDKQLRQTAGIISRLQAEPGALAARPKMRGISLEERIVVRFLGAEEAQAERQAPYFSPQMPDGLQTVSSGNESWRVFVRTDAHGVRVAVAQQTSVRNAAAQRSALRSLVPFAFLAPVLLVLVALLIRKLFAPLRALAVQVGRRSHDDTSGLAAAGLPREVQPFVAEINRLLMRVGLAMQRQRRFIADAAHELRTPLAAMTLQGERLAAASMPDEARQRTLALADGLKRTRLMLDGLLALARSQQGGRDAGAQASLGRTVHTVIEDLVPLAEARGIDLGLAHPGDAQVQAAPVDLHMLVKNLVENAIRYAPPGGRVDVSVLPGEGSAELIVEDNGPGIPEHERERVFDAFYRILGNGEQTGSGLGLAIVKAVADGVGATVALEDATAPGQGLRVRVRFPLSSAFSAPPAA